MILTIARRDPVTARPNETVHDVIGLLNYYKVGCVVVIEDGRPVGILTDRDVALRMLPLLEQGRTPADLTAADLMTRHPKTIHEEQGFDDALAIMNGDDVRRLPVTDKDGRLRGLVTLDDLLRAMCRSLHTAVKVIDRQWRGGERERGSKPPVVSERQVLTPL